MRSLAPAVPAVRDGEWVRFAQAEYGVAPGQAAVAYDGSRLLGGGLDRGNRLGRRERDECRRRIVPAFCCSAQRDGMTEVLLIKPGGPFWRNKDAGAWMIPKGMIEPGEAPAEAALREFEEETGTRLTAAPFPLATVRQSGGKVVEAFAVEGDLDRRDDPVQRVRGRMAAAKRTAPALSRSRRSALDELRRSPRDDASEPASADRRARGETERIG